MKIDSKAELILVEVTPCAIESRAFSLIAVSITPTYLDLHKKAGKRIDQRGVSSSMSCLSHPSPRT